MSTVTLGTTPLPAVLAPPGSGRPKAPRALNGIMAGAPDGRSDGATGLQLAAPTVRWARLAGVWQGSCTTPDLWVQAKPRYRDRTGASLSERQRQVLPGSCCQSLAPLPDDRMRHAVRFQCSLASRGCHGSKMDKEQYQFGLVRPAGPKGSLARRLTPREWRKPRNCRGGHGCNHADDFMRLYEIINSARHVNVLTHSYAAPPGLLTDSSPK